MVRRPITVRLSSGPVDSQRLEEDFQTFCSAYVSEIVFANQDNMASEEIEGALHTVRERFSESKIQEGETARSA